MKKFVFAVFVFTLILSGCAQENGNAPFSQISEDSLYSTTVTRNIDGTIQQNYSDFKAGENRQAVSLNTATVYTSPSRNSRAVTSRNMAMYVNRSLYPSIQDAVTLYISDVEKDGYAVTLRLMDNSGSPEELKNTLINDRNSHNIEGVFLVGQLPIAWFETIEIWYDRNAQFPCDLYLMDLDGDWQDSDNNGVYDIHGGNYRADIWLGRLMAHNLTYSTKSEAEHINNYFRKNHAYRTGSLRLKDKAFTIINKDWQNSRFDTSVSIAYPNNTIIKDPKETVTGDAYRSHITTAANNKYETLLIAAHSSPSGHGFYRGSFRSSEIEQLGVQVHFYNLFACSSVRYTSQNSLGVWYALQSQYGLNVVGTTKTGSMLNFSYFYTPISEGKNLGNAYLDWFKQVVTTTEGSQSWYYGNTMIGDPVLRISRFLGSSTFSKNYDQVFVRGSCNDWTTSPMELVADNTWQVEVSFGNEANQRFKFDINGDWSINFGDNNSDGTAEQSGEDISISASGTYTITFNDDTKTYTVKKKDDGEFAKNYPHVYIRGTSNGWNTATMNLVADHSWQLDVSFPAADNQRFKFDIHGDWSLNFGDNNADSIADQAGSDITVDGGSEYSITFNDASMKYSVVKKNDQQFKHNFDQLYFRGTANNWSAAPMKLVADNTWSLNVSFPAGSEGLYKFDVYGDWSVNYGDVDRNGIANQNGPDIPISGGHTYEIRFNDSYHSYSAVIQ